MKPCALPCRKPQFPAASRRNFMNSCQKIDALITPFVDGELADPDSRSVEEHLRRCPPCHSRVDAERAVRSLIQARKTGFGARRAPEALRARCAAAAVTSRQSLLTERRLATGDWRLATWRL